MPEVSIVIALYNHADYISDCLKSVLLQSFQDMEIIIIDDASTDHPEKKIVPLLKDKRVVYRRLDKNAGPSRARNEAIRQSSGDFIAFVDADDMLTKKSIEYRVNTIKQKNLLWVHGRACNLIGKKIKQDMDFHEQWLKFCKQMPVPITLYSKSVHSNSVLVKKSFYKILGLFDEDIRYGEDQDMWKRALAFGYIPGYVEHVVCIYRHHALQTRFKKGAKELKKECFDLIDKRLQIRLKEGINNSNTIMWDH